MSIRADNSSDASRPKVRLDPVGFWSYAHDNEGLSEGRLGEILRQIKSELAARFGRLEIFQDTSAIRHGDEWEARIDEWIARSTFFIPILTPHFIQSKWCLHEVERFLKREEELFAAYPDLPRSSRIFPILYVDIDGAPSPRPDLVEQLVERNWFDMRELRYAERVDIGAVGREIGHYAKSIRTLLMIEVATPLTAQEQDTLRQQEADEQARREAEEATAAALAAEKARNEADQEARRHAGVEQAEALAWQHAEDARQREQAEREKALLADAERRRRERADRASRWAAGRVFVRWRGLAIAGMAIVVTILVAVGFAMRGAAVDPLWTGNASLDSPTSNNVVGGDPPAKPAPPQTTIPDLSWVEGKWGLAGKCDKPTLITIDGGVVVLTYDSGEPDRNVINPNQTDPASILETQGAVFARKGSTKLTVQYPGARFVELIKC